jgi:hypothetical protein
MNARQQLVYESIKQSVVALRHPMFNRREIAGLRAELEKAAKAIAELNQTQYGGSQNLGSAGRQIEIFRRDVRRRLLRISSHAVVALEGLPGIEEDVRVPHANAKTADLLEATTRIIKNVRPHLKTLYRTGLPKDSIARLEAVAKSLAAKMEDPNPAMARRSRATSAIPDALRRARKIVRAIDSTIKLEFADEVTTLKVWAHAKRIPGRIGRPKIRRRVAGKA